MRVRSPVFILRVVVRALASETSRDLSNPRELANVQVDSELLSHATIRDLLIDLALTGLPLLTKQADRCERTMHGEIL
jgi:hypothetical protein